MNMDLQKEINRLKENLVAVTRYVGKKLEEVETTQQAHADLLRVLITHLQGSDSVQLLHQLREQLHREGAWIEATKEQFENTVTATNGAAMQEIDAYLEQHAAMYRKALEKAMPKDVLVTVFPSSR